MGNINITKRDVIWGYIAQFFQIASGLITLPLILNMLSAEEIGMNYLMLTIGSLVSLFDFGFAPQFGRNVSYIFSGVQELNREGVGTNTGTVNYELLSTMISVAKMVYRILGCIVLALMLSLGSLYIYQVTNGFVNVNHCLEIWIIYSISTFFNIYYTYFSSLLTGKGLIKEAKKAMLASRIIYIVLTFIFLFWGLGLLGVALANLIAPFVNRYCSHGFFFTGELLKQIEVYQITKKEKIRLFRVIWYNARKLGLVFVGSYAINRLGMFFAGLYLSLEEIASYGLMIQLMGVVTTISTTLFTVSGPQFAALRIEKDRGRLLQRFAFTMNIFYLLFVVGSLFLILGAPLVLQKLNSNVILPAWYVLLFYSIVALLENNHSNFATFIVTENKIPFMESSLLAGLAIAIGSFLSLKYTMLGVLGLVIVQCACQIVYANWKWPYVVCRDFNISFLTFVKIGLDESLNKLRYYGRRKY